VSNAGYRHDPGRPFNSTLSFDLLKNDEDRETDTVTEKQNEVNGIIKQAVQNVSDRRTR
jgi:hypothetical protein